MFLMKNPNFFIKKHTILQFKSLLRISHHTHTNKWLPFGSHLFFIQMTK